MRCRQLLEFFHLLFFDGEVAFLFLFSSSSPCMKLIVKDGAENSFHRATSACLVTCRPGERLEQEKSTKFNPGKSRQLHNGLRSGIYV